MDVSSSSSSKTTHRKQRPALPLIAQRDALEGWTTGGSVSRREQEYIAWVKRIVDETTDLPGTLRCLTASTALLWFRVCDVGSLWALSVTCRALRGRASAFGTASLLEVAAALWCRDLYRSYRPRLPPEHHVPFGSALLPMTRGKSRLSRPSWLARLRSLSGGCAVAVGSFHDKTGVAMTVFEILDGSLSELSRRPMRASLRAVSGLTHVDLCCVNYRGSLLAVLRTHDPFVDAVVSTTTATTQAATAAAADEQFAQTQAQGAHAHAHAAGGTRRRGDDATNDNRLQRHRNRRRAGSWDDETLYDDERRPRRVVEPASPLARQRRTAARRGGAPSQQQQQHQTEQQQPLGGQVGADDDDDDDDMLDDDDDDDFLVFDQAAHQATQNDDDEDETNGGRVGNTATGNNTTGDEEQVRGPQRFQGGGPRGQQTALLSSENGKRKLAGDDAVRWDPSTARWHVMPLWRGGSACAALRSTNFRRATCVDGRGRLVVASCDCRRTGARRHRPRPPFQPDRDELDRRPWSFARRESFAAGPEEDRDDEDADRPQQEDADFGDAHRWAELPSLQPWRETASVDLVAVDFTPAVRWEPDLEDVDLFKAEAPPVLARRHAQDWLARRFHASRLARARRARAQSSDGGVLFQQQQQQRGTTTAFAGDFFSSQQQSQSQGQSQGQGHGPSSLLVAVTTDSNRHAKPDVAVSVYVLDEVLGSWVLVAVAPFRGTGAISAAAVGNDVVVASSLSNAVVLSLETLKWRRCRSDPRKRKGEKRLVGDGPGAADNRENNGSPGGNNNNGNFSASQGGAPLAADRRQRSRNDAGRANINNDNGDGNGNDDADDPSADNLVTHFQSEEDFENENHFSAAAAADDPGGRLYFPGGGRASATSASPWVASHSRLTLVSGPSADAASAILLTARHAYVFDLKRDNDGHLAFRQSAVAPINDDSNVTFGDAPPTWTTLLLPLPL